MNINKTLKASTLGVLITITSALMTAVAPSAEASYYSPHPQHGLHYIRYYYGEPTDAENLNTVKGIMGLDSGDNLANYTIANLFTPEDNANGFSITTDTFSNEGPISGSWTFDPTASTFDTIDYLIFQSEDKFTIWSYLGSELAGVWNNYVFHGSPVTSVSAYSSAISEVPLPTAAWLFGSALLGLVTIKRRKH